MNLITDKNILDTFLNLCLHIYKEQKYYLDIDALEPLQYSEYHKDNEYGWHVDQGKRLRQDNRVRSVTKGIRKSLVGWILGPIYK